MSASGNAGTIGAPSGSPFIAANPLAASTSVDLPPERLAVGGPLAQRIAGLRLLDLHHVGAEVRHQHAGDAAGNHARQVEDANAGKRLHRCSILARHVWITIQVLSSAMVCSFIVVTTQRSTGLRKELGVPLYHQIQHLLRYRIHNAQYPPGTQIPSEHELSAELGVSRVTLREALRELVREHLLVKIQGKGTFVASNPPKRLSPVRYTGFLEELQERVRKLRVTDVEIAQVPATADLKRVLQLDDATSELTSIKRLRLLDDQPYSFTQNYLPTEIGVRIRPKDLYATPLLKILQEDLKIPIVRAKETIEAAPADPETAQRRKVPLLVQPDAGDAKRPLGVGDRSGNVGLDD